MKRSWLAALLATALAGLATAQAKPEPQAPFVRCVKCKNAGRLACGEHEKTEAPLEDGVLYCSTIAKCAVCAGTGWLDCADCEQPELEKQLLKKKTDMPSRERSLAELDNKMGRALRKVETAHFVLVWEINTLKVDKRQVEHHELMHIYAARLEQLFADYVAAFHCGAGEFALKIKVFVWWYQKDQEEGSLRFAGQGGPSGIKLLGTPVAYSVLGNKQHFNGDEQLHRNLMHNVAHLLLSHQNPSLWIGNLKGGWVDEGVAHWFEDKYFGKCDNYCYEEQNSNVDFKGGQWKPVVRKMVAMDDVLPVSEVMAQNTDGLKLPMHTLAFSYVDYLLALDGAKFNAFCKLLRQKVVTRDAFKKVYDWTPLDFEVKWKAWVLETYPTR